MEKKNITDLSKVELKAAIFDRQVEIQRLNKEIEILVQHLMGNEIDPISADDSDSNNYGSSPQKKTRSSKKVSAKK